MRSDVFETARFLPGFRKTPLSGSVLEKKKRCLQGGRRKAPCFICGGGGGGGGGGGISFMTVFAGVHFLHQPGANHAPRPSVTHYLHTLNININNIIIIIVIIIIIIIITIIIVFNSNKLFLLKLTLSKLKCYYDFIIFFNWI